MLYKKLIIPLLVLCSACHKYVEIEPKGKVLPTTLNDFQLLLNNNRIFNLSGGNTDLMTDDVDFRDVDMFTKENPATLNIYSWAEVIYQADEDDAEWLLYYKQVYTANVVIDGAANVKDATAAEKAALIVKAKVHRAYAFLCLVNQYAPQYAEGTAAKDAGIPLLLEPTYTASLERASVKTVYEQIVNDLTASIEALPDLPTVKTDPSKAAAYALLARTYLYMGHYADALKNADNALKLQSTLLDLRYLADSNNPFDFLGIVATEENPEVIFMKAAYNQDAPIFLSQELIDLLGPDDLRFKVFAIGDHLLSDYDGYQFSYISPLEARHVGPRVSEMYLIKAECQARAGDFSGAVQTANIVRQQRFAPAKYVALTATGPQEALTKVLEERRRELMGRGFRLPDLKRLNLEPALAKTVTHTWRNGATITLKPGSNRYIFPVGPKIINMNPEIGQSPR